MEVNEQRSGIAIDIDDTLANTSRYFLAQLEEKFPNPEGLSLDQIVAKYGSPSNAPYWSEGEPAEWLQNQAYENGAQESVGVVEGALGAVKKIASKVPIKAYITSRLASVEPGTVRWLKKYGFPEADIITRPNDLENVDPSIWKAELLKQMYPEILCIIDDHPGLIQALGRDYKGTVCLFGDYPHYQYPDLQANIFRSPEWQAIANFIINRFG